MPRRKVFLHALAALVVTIGMVTGAALGRSSATAASSAALTSNFYGSAPYVMPLDNAPPDLSQVMSATGQKAFELAFILAGGGCTPAWDGTCSSVPQASWDFTKFTQQFAAATPPVGPPIPPPPPPGSCSAPAWSSTAVYTGGNLVTFQNHTWKAKWWTQGDTPGGSVGVWADQGPCQA